MAETVLCSYDAAIHVIEDNTTLAVQCCCEGYRNNNIVVVIMVADHNLKQFFLPLSYLCDYVFGCHLAL
jgi:hypothetical protein